MIFSSLTCFRNGVSSFLIISFLGPGQFYWYKCDQDSFRYDGGPNVDPDDDPDDDPDHDRDPDLDASLQPDQGLPVLLLLLLEGVQLVGEDAVLVPPGVLIRPDVIPGGKKRKFLGISQLSTFYKCN